MGDRKGSQGIARDRKGSQGIVRRIQMSLSADDRKKMKTEYRETQPPAGVFQIKNTVTGKIFLVASINIKAAMNRHEFQLNFGSHPNAVLQEDWKKYGADSFALEILDFIEPDNDSNRNMSDDVKVLEDMWLENLRPFGDRGYNKEMK